MRMLLLIIVVGLSGCGVAIADEVNYPPSTLPSSGSTQSDGIEINFPEVRLTLTDVNSDDFKVTITGDTAFIKSIGFSRVDGAKLNIKSNKLNGHHARIRFKFGVLQYLTDDRPAPQLDFTWELGWRRIETTNNRIQIPQLYRNRENAIDAFEFLGFTGKDEFESIFESEHFATVKPISYKMQKEQFTTLLSERNRYEQCCPEYIKQANEFLKKRPDDFKTFGDLGVEIFLSELEIQISGINADGKQVTYTITNVRG